MQHAGRPIRPRTGGQARYVEAIRGHDLVFCTGPAGTGKTYLAVAMAVQALKQQAIRKIVLVRPAVEAGESLGFLPGDLQAKINPYLRPLLDALREMMDYEQVKRYTEQDLIEMIPLAYMRGRTLNEAFVILDEAQNTTVAQMKMFLTRMGLGTKMVVSGDTTQIDLPTPCPQRADRRDHFGCKESTVSATSRSAIRTSCAIDWCSRSCWRTTTEPKRRPRQPLGHVYEQRISQANAIGTRGGAGIAAGLSGAYLGLSAAGRRAGPAGPVHAMRRGAVADHRRLGATVRLSHRLHAAAQHRGPGAVQEARAAAAPWKPANGPSAKSARCTSRTVSRWYSCKRG